MLHLLPVVAKGAHRVQTVVRFEDSVRWKLDFNLTYFASNHLSIRHC